MPIPIAGHELLRWHGRWAELESFAAEPKPSPTWETYRCMYEATGRLHRTTRILRLRLPLPAVATYGPPTSLRRWMAVTEDRVEHSVTGRSLARWANTLIRKMARQWVPATRLPCQIIHGDVRLANVRATVERDPVYLDFGFAAYRPRVHEFAYALAWILLGPDDSGRGDDFEWGRLPEFIAAYEEAAGDRLTSIERSSLWSFVASVPIYLAAISGYTPDPVDHLAGQEVFLRIGAWVLDHPPKI